jgi:NifU-like protein
VEEVLARVLKEQGRTFDPTAAAPVPTPVPAQASAKPPKLGTLQRIRRIEAAIESVRPNLRRDHGDVELVEVDGKNVYVNMTGACSGCQMASVTLEGLQQRIIEELGELIRVLPASAMRQRA